MKEAILSTAYLAPVQYYTKLYACSRVYVETNEHYVKQTYRNRCVIAGAGGPLPLTVPIERGDASHTPMRDIRISDHGNWRHLHWNALVSAYENSPFFEYYADDLHPVYEKKYTFLADFNMDLQQTLCSLLGLSPEVVMPQNYIDADALSTAIDYRETIRPKVGFATDTLFVPKEYWQVFAAKNGFLPNLSIVDLLFNMGSEARLVLRDSVCEPARE